MTASSEALRNADQIIKALNDNGHGDYSAHQQGIALAIYDNGHWNGDWDASYDPQDTDDTSPLETIRVIQEDEYDQHMDDDEDAPAHDDMVAEVPNGYLFIA